jgi:hypothetical protein
MGAAELETLYVRNPLLHSSCLAGGQRRIYDRDLLLVGKRLAYALVGSAREPSGPTENPA